MSRTESFWDRMTENQEKDAKRFEVLQNWIIEKTVPYLEKNRILLDYACGNGMKTVELAHHVKKITGIDISRKAVELAGIKAAQSGAGNTEFFKADIFDSRLQPESLDTITAFNILHGVDDIQAVLRRIDTLLKPGGKFISATPCLNENSSFILNLQFFLFRLACFLKIIPITIRRFTFIELEKAVGKAGFKTLESDQNFSELSCLFIAAEKQ